MAKYVFGRTVEMDVAQAREAVTQALAKEGFGVLSEIDVAATLKKKLGLERPAYLILGACNPQFAAQALEAEPQIGALLPCNVVVRAGDGGKTVVEFMDPDVMLGLVDAPGIAPIAAEVKARLMRVMNGL